MGDFAVVRAVATFSLAMLSVLDSSQRILDSSQNNLNIQSQRYLARFASTRAMDC
jgi:hypothetical protein